MRTLPFDYAVRNLGRAPVRSALGLAGSVLVVLLVLAAAGFVTGMTRSLTVTGGDDNVMILGSGSEESIERSQIPFRSAAIAAASLPGIRERLGERYVSPEVHLALAVRTEVDQEQGSLTVVRGVLPVAFLVHPQVRIVEGRAPQPGRDEILVGALLSEKLGVALPLGARVWLDGRPWSIVGRFAAPRTVMQGEIWMGLTDLQVIAQRDTLSCVVVTLDGSGRTELADVQSFAFQRLDLELTAMGEAEYYSKLSDFLAPIRAMVLTTAFLIALGGILGGLNTMYAAVAARARELGTLQVLGYSRAAVITSLIEESLLVAVLGALLACAVGLVVLDGLAVRFSMGVFGLVIDGPVILAGLGAGIALGVLGALPPALRCLKRPIPEALRA